MKIFKKKYINDLFPQIRMEPQFYEVVLVTTNCLQKGYLFVCAGLNLSDLRLFYSFTSTKILKSKVTKW